RIRWHDHGSRETTAHHLAESAWPATLTAAGARNAAAAAGSDRHCAPEAKQVPRLPPCGDRGHGLLNEVSHGSRLRAAQTRQAASTSAKAGRAAARAPPAAIGLWRRPGAGNAGARGGAPGD